MARSRNKKPYNPEKKMASPTLLDLMPKNEILTGKASRVPRNAMATVNGVYEKNFSTSDFSATKFTFQTLRKISKHSGLLQAILARRDLQIYQIAKRYKYEGDIGYKIVHERHHEANFNVGDVFNDACRKVEGMIEVPWGYLEPSFSGFCSKFIKDLLIINRPCIEVGLNSKGIPMSFGAIDGANIFPTLEVLKKLVPQMGINPLKAFGSGYENRNSKSNELALEFVGEKFNLENIKSSTEYFYMDQMVPTAAYTMDEIIIMPIMPTTDVIEYGYPPSMVERSIRLIMAEMLAMSYNMNYFQFGTMVDTMIGVIGSYDDDHIQDLVETFRQNHTGIDGAHRVPVLPLKNPDDIHIYNLRQNNRDMVYAEFMNLVTSLTCAVFGMPPEEINIRSQGGSNSGINFENRNQQIQQNREEGLFAVRNQIRAAMNLMIKKINPDMTFEWYGLSDDSDQRRRDSAQRELQTGGITKREYRQRLGYTPVPEGMKDEDVDIFQDQAWLTIHNNAQQQEQMEKQQKQAQDDSLKQDDMASMLGDSGQQDNEQDKQQEDQKPYKSFKEQGDDGYKEPDFGDEGQDE